MSGTYEANAGVDEARAATEAAVAASQATAAARQVDAERFQTEYGAAVLGGHGFVGQAATDDIGSDPDVTPDASDRP
jgi:hypothetical protein